MECRMRNYMVGFYLVIQISWNIMWVTWSDMFVVCISTLLFMGKIWVSWSITFRTVRIHITSGMINFLQKIWVLYVYYGKIVQVQFFFNSIRLCLIWGFIKRWMLPEHRVFAYYITAFFWWFPPLKRDHKYLLS